METLERIDVQLHQRLGLYDRHLLDLHPALGREDEERLLGAAIERDREVVLALDLRGALDPEPAHNVALDLHAENRGSVRLGLLRARGDLDAAGLAAPAHVNLSFHDHRAAELLGGGARLGGRLRQPSLAGRKTVPAEKLLALVLVEIHSRA